MTDRRAFMTASLLAPALLAASVKGAAAQTRSLGRPSAKLGLPCVISTWDFGVAANQAAWAVLSKGGRLADPRRDRQVFRSEDLPDEVLDLIANAEAPAEAAALDHEVKDWKG